MRSCSVVCVVVLAALTVVSLTVGESTSSSWIQWGGPGQEFRAASTGLAAEWPEAGPRELWSRELGDGYSAILVEDGRLYTMYRSDEKEAVICLDATDGKTIWEQRYEHEPAEGHVRNFGSGPRSTPLIDGDRIFTIGVAGKMHALNKKDGKVLWTHDLWDGVRRQQAPARLLLEPHRLQGHRHRAGGGRGSEHRRPSTRRTAAWRGRRSTSPTATRRRESSTSVARTS